MSLQVLVNTVVTNLKTTRFQALEIISDFLNNIPKKFTRISLENLVKNHSYDENTIETLLKPLIEEGFVEVKYAYICSTGYNSTAKTLDEVCDGCSKKISFLHEITELFHFKGETLEMISGELNEEAINKYVMTGFRRNLNSLIENKSHLIPFFGAGLSVPLGYPSWKGLLILLKDSIEVDHERASYQGMIDRGDFLKALEHLKYVTSMDEYEIKKDIRKAFDNIDFNSVFQLDNNYLDLYELKSDFYLTTNYDNTFTEYASKIGKFVMPFCNDDILDTQRLLRESRQRVIHLHGNLEKEETMIVTETDYNSLYGNEDFKRNLLSIMSNKSLLFLGFSFNDVFFNNLYESIIKHVRGEHYIILPNTNITTAQTFMEDRLKVIGINVELDSDGRYNIADYVKSVRTVLNQLK